MPNQVSTGHSWQLLPHHGLREKAPGAVSGPSDPPRIAWGSECGAPGVAFRRCTPCPLLWLPLVRVLSRRDAINPGPGHAWLAPGRTGAMIGDLSCPGQLLMLRLLRCHWRVKRGRRSEELRRLLRLLLVGVLPLRLRGGLLVLCWRQRQLAACWRNRGLLAVRRAALDDVCCLRSKDFPSLTCWSVKIASLLGRLLDRRANPRRYPSVQIFPDVHRNFTIFLRYEGC